jgi:ADP-ribose pyrophosphatase YjhB (NUDIX family)
MSQPFGSMGVQVNKPMICEGEVQELIAQHGTPVRRNYWIQADEYIRSYRWQPTSDRRAEVVFAIQNPAGQIWLHAKAHYPARIYRLLSGGVHPHEGVADALWREIAEETSLDCTIEKFLGLITYHFTYAEEVAHFASYIFTLRSDFTQPVCERDNEISAFHAVLPSQLGDVSNDLRNLIGDRHGWGQWRALAVDLVHEQLMSSANSANTIDPQVL